MNDAGIPESEGEAVDEIVKLAGPIGGMVDCPQLVRHLR